MCRQSSGNLSPTNSPHPLGLLSVRRELATHRAAEQALLSGCDVRRQPARASVLAVFDRAGDRRFFCGAGSRTSATVDAAKISRSAASQC
jgi:hypothetical protein